ncbi:MAG: anthranilate synthase component 1 [Gammaproteobacteria bacterium]|nr:anthranilate synthase component 1 [Gammaproteobacteria bacterium]
MQVNTLIKKIPLSLSPIDSYKRTCQLGRKADTVLLETAEAASHANQKSIIGISSAVKIKSIDDIVEISALNDNGKAFLKSFDTEAIQEFTFEVSPQKIIAKLKPQPPVYDEELRLVQASSLDILKSIKQQLVASAQDNESTYLLGAFSFDLVDQFEVLPTINKPDEDYVFYLADTLLIQSLNSNSAQIIVKGFGEYAAHNIHLGLQIEQVEKLLRIPSESYQALNQSSCVQVSISDRDFMQQVNEGKESILRGDVFQVVLSRNYQMDCQQPLQAYENLRTSNPSPYMYFINFSDKQLFGASPESALKVDANKEVSLYPIAGTRKRAIINEQIDHEHDSLIEYELIDDEKESAEHMMLLDLARNDIARVVEYGTRKVTQLKKIVKYSHVMHLVSEVKGKLRSDLDPIDAYKACSNMGTLTGAPKIKAMHLIRKFEKNGRGLYGGAVAAINANNEFDSAIIIRSAVVKDGTAKITAGAGVVYDSVAELEALETQNKAQAVINACLASIKLKDVAA